MTLGFTGEMWFWKGPAPWHFVTVPEEECGELAATSALVTYGWGMAPVRVQIGGTGWADVAVPEGRAVHRAGAGAGAEGRGA
ncbi:DUF1905 domain-containing protein [Micromonospora sp. NBC_00898]|uniref:DUF1905 domain-containing protein n=1 Tax=Micromonospora sp. NBC_00898 TaxID=2975981 RepID=UPI003869AA2E|nr:DUF1905 domain-containing protein [Micromonospora sp. NBC_00898]